MTSLSFPELKADRSRRSFDIRAMIAAREDERYSLNAQHMNEMMVRVLQTIGTDVGFQKGQGQYLYDRRGDRYLDLLSGWGVFGVGRNHPLVRDALNGVLAADLPNLVQMDASVLAGLARRAPARVRALSRQGLLRQFRARRRSRRRSNSRGARRAGPTSSIAATPFTASPMARCR